ncbi:MAG: OB-fold domain-containing protein [Deltaproteobacteria bacterium]|nr:OB-fold domain-containing protein [Deltaproteobacteria bacterium]
MAGIVRYGSYVPYFRLTRAALGRGSGERAIASYDEDAVSMGVEAAREALRSEAGSVAGVIDTLLYATTSPAYAEKLDAGIVHAACSLPAGTTALDLGGSTRAGLTSLLAGLDLASAGRRGLLVESEVVVGAPEGERERNGGDAAAAFVLGPDAQSVVVESARASRTHELLDVWRAPDERFSRQWEARFGAETLLPLLCEVATEALQRAGLQPADLATVVVDSTNARVVRGLPAALGLKPEQVADSLAGSVGRTGSAHAGLLLARALDVAKPGDRIAVLVAADGADALILEVTDRIAIGRPRHAVDDWIASSCNDVTHHAYLKWRGVLPFEPPRRPDPDRPAAPPMHRAARWKYAFEGMRCSACGKANLPPQRVCVICGAVDQMKPESFADATCRIATYAIDRLAYSLQPPVVAAIVDFDPDGRFQSELTDVDPEKVAIGDELEMTFRRYFTADSVHNYFWKARPRR